MFVNLEKEDLIKLVTSCDPKDYEDGFIFEKLGFGDYRGRTQLQWHWCRSALEKLDEETLLDLYSTLRGKLYEFVKE